LKVLKIPHQGPTAKDRLRSLFKFIENNLEALADLAIMIALVSLVITGFLRGKSIDYNIEAIEKLNRIVMGEHSADD